MSRYNKYFLLIFTIIVLLTFQSSFAFALELSYPALPGISITESTNLSQYVQYVFVFIVIATGIIGVISIAIAGMSILISAGNPAAISAARERIVSAVLGIILLMFSFIILRTINPQLVTPIENPLLKGPGIYFKGCNIACKNGVGTIDDLHPDGFIYKEAVKSVSDLTDPSEIPPGYSSLMYYCPAGTNGNKTLLVWLYNQKDFQIDRDKNGGPDVNTFSIPCGLDDKASTLDFGPVLSFMWDYEDDGIYFYLQDKCRGISSCYDVDSCAQKTDGDIPLFDNNGDWDAQTVRSMRIVSGQDPRTRYGVVLHRDSDFAGECSAPIINSSPGSLCIDSTSNPPFPSLPPTLGNPDGSLFDPWSISIFTQNPYYELSGNGVEVWSNNLLKEILPDEILGQYSVYAGYAGDPNNGYNGTPDEFLAAKGESRGAVSQDECVAPDSEVGTCLREIIPNGNYYAILYAQYYNLLGATTYDKSCKIFNEGVDFQDFIRLLSHEKNLYRMDLMPFP